MSYTILKTDGTAITSVVDGTIDQVTTDLTLIGKNTSGYGIFLNDNFVRLLENFANTAEPNNPIKGQLWYDTTENRLKIYNGSQFVVSGGTIVSNNVPSSITEGDLWIDNVRQQLYFNDGIQTVLAGPLYTADQGLSGFTVEDILDTNQIQHTIVYLFVGQTLLGIFSKDTFVPKEPIAGMSGTIKTGFTASTLNNLAFNVPTSEAASLIAADGSLKYAGDFVSTSDDSQSTGILSIQNSTPLILGPSANSEFNVSPSLFQIKSNSINQNFEIGMFNNEGVLPSVFVNSANKRVGIYTDVPSATLDVNGDVSIAGTLTVAGETSFTNSTTLQITDKNIELAKVETPTDVTADGGGITVKGATDKTLSWVSSTSAWTSSENINLVSGKTYKINGQDVLTGSALGTGITNAPGLTSIGTLTSLQVTNIGITSNTISYVNPVTTNGNIVIQPKGSGAVDVTDSLIVNVATPISDTDASNKAYVDSKVRSASLAIGLTVGAKSNTQVSADYLSKIFPNDEHTDGTICRVFVNDDSSIREFALQAGTWVFSRNL